MSGIGKLFDQLVISYEQQKCARALELCELKHRLIAAIESECDELQQKWDKDDGE